MADVEENVVAVPDRHGDMRTKPESVQGRKGAKKYIGVREGERIVKVVEDCGRAVRR